MIYGPVAQKVSSMFRKVLVEKRHGGTNESISPTLEAAGGNPARFALITAKETEHDR